jgi:hypothetical protein
MLVLARFLIIAVMISSLPSCITVQPALRVNPTGGLHSRVVFYLADLFHEQPPAFAITDVTVYEKQTQYQSLVIWNGQGEETLHSIVYGAKYKGLREIPPTRPLRIGGQYKVMIYTKTGAKNFDMVSFRIDENGAVIPIQNWW